MTELLLAPRVYHAALGEEISCATAAFVIPEVVAIALGRVANGQWS